MQIQRSAQTTLTRWQENPLEFFTDVLGCKPWAGQIQILQAVAKHKEVAVKSCHSVGKDWLSAHILLWWIAVHKPSAAATTAPTDRQVKEILWSEVERANNRSKIALGGTLLKQKFYISDDQKALGFTSGDTSDRFQGIHSENLLIILDEAAAIAPAVYVGADACLASGTKRRRLEIGNPTDPLSSFAKSFSTPGIHKISISAFDTPNFTEFGITEDDIVNKTWQNKITHDYPTPYLISPEWVAEKYERWKPDSPLYISRIQAQFPPSGSDALIPLSHIEAAIKRALEPSGPVIMGVDPARQGMDYAVIALRKGPVIRILARYPKCDDTMPFVGHVRRFAREHNPDQIVVDSVGLGGPIADRLREKRLPVIDAGAGETADDPREYVDQRAQWHWALREACEDGDIDLDPADEELIQQMAAIKWKPDSRGRVRIQRKDDMKGKEEQMAKLGFHSPDDLDAVCLTYAGVTRRMIEFNKAMRNV